MIVGGPAAEDDAEGTESTDPNHEEQADVDVTRHLKPRADRDGTHRCQRRGHGEDRRQPEDELVGVVGNEVFLEKKLQRIGNGLQQAVGANAHGAEARLHVGHDLALNKHDVAGDERNNQNDQHGAEQFDPPGLHKREYGVEHRAHRYQARSSAPFLYSQTYPTRRTPRKTNMGRSANAARWAASQPRNKTAHGKRKIVSTFNIMKSMAMM